MAEPKVEVVKMQGRTFVLFDDVLAVDAVKLREVVMRNFNKLKVERRRDGLCACGEPRGHAMVCAFTEPAMGKGVNVNFSGEKPRKQYPKGYKAPLKINEREFKKP